MILKGIVSGSKLSSCVSGFDDGLEDFVGFLILVEKGFVTIPAVCYHFPQVIIRAVVRSDAFYRTTVRRFCVLRMWGIVLTRSSSRHHFITCLVRLVKWGGPLVYQNTSKSTQDGHCPGSFEVNLRFARGEWRGSVPRHHSFSAHVRRVRAGETPGGWFWRLPVAAPPICFCSRPSEHLSHFGFRLR